jgi:hypothetical protein
MIFSPENALKSFETFTAECTLKTDQIQDASLFPLELLAE